MSFLQKLRNSMYRFMYGRYGTDALNRALLNTDYTATGGAYDLPYNTYRYSGIPEGPICSPRKSSVVAALNPADSKYIFYVLGTKGDGSHVFAETYAEHQKNTDAYLKWKANH